MGDNVGELTVEGSGNVTIAGGNLAVEEDGLVGGWFGRLAAELFDEGKELGGVMFVGAGFSALNPGFLIGLVDVLLYLLVEEGEPGIGGGVRTNGVALTDKALGGVGEVGDHVRDVSFRDELFGGVEEDAPERALAGAAGGRGLQGRKALLSPGGESLPVGFPEVGEGVAGGFWAVHGENPTQLNDDGEVVGVAGDDGAPFGVYCNMGRGNGEVR